MLHCIESASGYPQLLRYVTLLFHFLHAPSSEVCFTNDRLSATTGMLFIVEVFNTIYMQSVCDEST